MRTRRGREKHINIYAISHLDPFTNTPIGAISNVDEPCANGSPGYFGLWQAGSNFGICAWNSANAEIQVVGDPFVRK